MFGGLRHTPKISKKLLESEYLVCNATASTNTPLGITQLWLPCFVASVFKALGIHSSRKVKEKDAQVVGVFLSPFLCMVMISGVGGRGAGAPLNALICRKSGQNH